MCNSTQIQHEIIIPNEKIPVKFFSFKGTDTKRIIPNHWHRSAELLFCAEGALHVWLEGKKYELQAHDFIFINSNQIHATQSPIENTVIVLQIPGDFLQNFSDEPTLFIMCNTIQICTEKQYAAAQHIRELLYQMYSHHTIKEQGYYLKIYALLFELGYSMVRDFKEDTRLQGYIKSQKHVERLSAICGYMKEHYQEALSLQMVAEQFGYTPQYLSRYFQRHVNMTFLTYLNSIRIDAAYKQLVTTDYSILYIAQENGFASAKAFNRIFKTIYHKSPGQFRKEIKLDMNM